VPLIRPAYSILQTACCHHYHHYHYLLHSIAAPNL
jgi:hypothetical protein